MLKRLFSRKRKYSNRFLKHYYTHKKELLRQRKNTYQEKKSMGICVRCSRIAVKGLVFCSYHREQKKKYNEHSRKAHR